jgi:hypothetical protein
MRITIDKKFWTHLGRYRALLWVTSATVLAGFGESARLHPMHDYAPWIFVVAVVALAIFLLSSGLHLMAALLRVLAAKPRWTRQEACLDRLQIGRESTHA